MKKILLSLCLIIAGVVSLHVTTVQAGAAIPLTGWAWSSNIGWLSFNSSNTVNSTLPSPMAYYTFEGNNAVDVSGNGYNGTLMGAPTFVAGKVGNRAIQLNGSSDYVSISQTIMPTAVTLSAWIKPGKFSGEQRIINFQSRFRLELKDNGLYCAFNTTGHGWDFCVTTSSTVLPIPNTWYHVAVTYDGASKYVYYINGVEAGSDSTRFSGQLTGGSSNVPPCIGNGCGDGNTTSYFQGTIDDARIYDRALTASEIQQLYAGNVAVQYGVTMSTSSPTSWGRLYGQAWSSNIGWLSFDDNDVAGCPEYDSSEAIDGCHPVINLTAGTQNVGKVTGWARITSMKNDDGSGWVHLSGTNHPSPDWNGPTGSSTKGVSFNVSKYAFSGYAYEPKVLGWLSFDAASTVGVPGVCVGKCGDGVTPTNIVAICKANGSREPITVSDNSTVNFTLSSVSGGSGTYTYTWSPLGAGNASGPGSASFPYAYNPGTYTPVVVIADNLSSTATISCPQVTVNGTTQQNYKLMITTSPTALNSSVPTGNYLNYFGSGYNTLTIRKGSNFYLAWSIQLVGAQKYFDLVPDLEVNGWNQIMISPNGGISSSLSTSNPVSVNSGTYKFKLYYADNLSSPIQWHYADEVTLNIVDSSLEEI